MSQQILKLGDKRELHASKQAIALNLVNTNKIVVSDKFKHIMMVLNILLAIYMMMI